MTPLGEIALFIGLAVAFSFAVAMLSFWYFEHTHMKSVVQHLNKELE